MKRFNHLKAILMILAISNLSMDLHATYNPEIGRFLQRDSLGTGPMIVFTSGGGPRFIFTDGPVVPNPNSNILSLSQYIDGMNLYQYVRSNPIMLTDPTGGCENKAKCKCCCIDNLTIENVKNLNSLGGRPVWGHSFDAKAQLSWKSSKSTAPCTFEWWEKTDLPAIPGHPVWQWTDMYKLAPNSPTFDPVRSPSNMNEIVVTDVPSLGISPGRNASRSLFIEVRVKSAPGCPCANKEKTVGVHQSLELKNGVGTKRELKTFSNPTWVP